MALLPKLDQELLKKDYFWLIIILLLTSLAYISVLNAEFCYDDNILIKTNANLGQWSYFLKAFSQEEETTATFISDTRHYRPIPTALSVIAYQAFGNNPLGWHIVNLIIYLLTIVIIFALFKSLINDQKIYLLATLIFAFHPVHSEIGCWVILFGYTILGLSYFTSLFCYIKWRKEGRSCWLILSLFAALIAVFAREYGVTLPLIIISYELCFFGGPFKQRVINGVKNSLAFFVITAFYFISRLIVFKGSLNLSLAQPIPLIVAIKSLPLVLVQYIKMLVWPHPLTILYSLRYVESFASKEFILPTTILLILLLLLVYIIKEKIINNAVLIFCILLSIITMLPILDVRRFSSEALVADRYIYIASAGFALLASMLIVKLTEKIPLKSAFILIVLLIGGIYFSLVSKQNLYWQNDLALLQHAYDISPNSPTAQYNLANALITSGDLPAAEDLLKSMLKQGNSVALFSLGGIAWQRQDFPTAIKYFEEALFKPHTFAERSQELLFTNTLSVSVTYFNYGYACWKVGELDKAQKAGEYLIKEYATYEYGYYLLGVVAEARKDYPTAIKFLQSAIKLNPANIDLHFGLAAVYEEAQSIEEAKAQYLIIIKLDPDNILAPGRLKELSQIAPK